MLAMYPHLNDEAKEQIVQQLKLHGICLPANAPLNLHAHLHSHNHQHHHHPLPLATATAIPLPAYADKADSSSNGALEQKSTDPRRRKADGGDSGLMAPSPSMGIAGGPPPPPLIIITDAVPVGPMPTPPPDGDGACSTSTSTSTSTRKPVKPRGRNRGRRGRKAQEEAMAAAEAAALVSAAQAAGGFPHGMVGLPPLPGGPPPPRKGPLTVSDEICEAARKLDRVRLCLLVVGRVLVRGGRCVHDMNTLTDAPICTHTTRINRHPHYRSFWTSSCP